MSRGLEQVEELALCPENKVDVPLRGVAGDGGWWWLCDITGSKLCFTKITIVSTAWGVGDTGRQDVETGNPGELRGDCCIIWVREGAGLGWAVVTEKKRGRAGWSSDYEEI